MSDRIKEGLEVKTFQNKKRIDFGRMDENERNYRQRSKRELKSHDPYSQMIQQREEIKENTNKVNCFTDENEPAFINTMSRTMDAFDLRMSTFGGKTKEGKAGNYDKFISEKRGFIRTSNGFENNNALTIV